MKQRFYKNAPPLNEGVLDNAMTALYNKMYKSDDAVNYFTTTQYHQVFTIKYLKNDKVTTKTIRDDFNNSLSFDVIQEACDKMKKEYESLAIEKPKVDETKDKIEFVDVDIQDTVECHTLEYKEDGGLPIINYTNGQIKQKVDDKNLIVSIDGGKDISLTTQEFIKSYYEGKYTPEDDGKKNCIINIMITITTGDNKGKTPLNLDVYTSLENVKKKIDISESLHEELDDCGIITIRTYNKDKKLMEKTISNPANITNMRKLIYKNLANEDAYSIDAYDGRGVCHFQAIRISEGDALSPFDIGDWVIDEDDFFHGTNKDNKYTFENDLGDVN